ncbi:MAG: hypothetical protein ACR2QK_00155, partial [Acidimicrobiales bacterium]
MALILIATGTATGALVGMVAAIVLSPFGSFSGGVLLLVVGLGLVLDGMNLATGRPRPPASGRQVPQEWGRLFSPRIVALLYGARLGVGPLTILSTWTWWSVTIAAALAGPAAGVVVGSTFGLVRLIVTVSMSTLSSSAPAETRAEHHALLFRRLRARRRSNWIALNGLGFVALLAVFLTGCGGGGGGEGTDRAAGDSQAPSTSAPTPTTAAPRTETSPPTAASASAAASVAVATGAVTPAGAVGEHPTQTGSDRSGRPPVEHQTIVTVQLEDVVRTATPEQNHQESDGPPSAHSLGGAAALTGQGTTEPAPAS